MRRIVSTKDEFIANIIRKTFPEFRGREATLSDSPPSELNSFWDEGNRNYFSFYNLSDGQVITVHSNHPFFEPNQPRKLATLPQEVLLIEHSIYGRGNNSLTIYGNTENFSKLLPQSNSLELSRAEQRVLNVTYSYIPKVRREYAALSEADYLSAIESLISKKLMNRNKSLTTEGKNVVNEHRREWEKV